MYFPFHIVTIILGLLLSSIFFFQKRNELYLILFAPFLLITLIIESLTVYMGSKGESTIPLFNFFSTFEFCFYLWAIQNIIQNKVVKKWLLYILLIYPIASTINILAVQKIDNFHSITYSIGCLLIIFSCIYYFYELFKNKYAINLVKDSGFWICSGLLFFYSVTFPLFVSANFMTEFPLKFGEYIGVALIILNVCLYSLFSIAFLCRINLRKLFSS